MDPATPEIPAFKHTWMHFHVGLEAPVCGCAQQHQAAVLHVDRHYDVLAEVLAFEPVRLVA